MTLSPQQWEEVKERAAELIAEKAMKEAGGVASLINLPIQFVTQVTGLSRHTIPKRMSITKTGDNKDAVTLKNLSAYLEKRTVPPKGTTLPETAKAGAVTPTSA